MKAQEDAVNRGEAEFRTDSETSSIISNDDSSLSSLSSLNEDEDYGKENNKRHRNVCWTLKAEGWDRSTLTLDPKVKYLVYQLEVGTDGYVHYQGYMELDEGMTVTAMKKKIFKSRAVSFIERNGSSQQAAHYCKKPVEKCVCPVCVRANTGDLGGKCICARCMECWDRDNWGLVYDDQGKRIAFEYGEQNSNVTLKEEEAQVIKALKELKDADEIIRMFPRYALHRGGNIDRVATAFKRKPSSVRKDLKVYWIFGVAGAGKSHVAITEILGEEEDYFHWCSGDTNANGYTQQKKALIEEWNPDIIEVDRLKRLLDIWKVNVRVLWGFTGWNPDTIVITSNHCPWDMIPKAGDRMAIGRRCVEVLYYTKPWFERTHPRDGVISIPYKFGVDPLIAWRQISKVSEPDV